MCKNCAQGHTRFSNVTKHHLIKKIFDIDQSDVEKHNQKKDLLCNKHKTDAISFYCTNCKEFGCHTCYIITHNKHECIEVEKADFKNITLLEELVNKVNENMKQQEDTVKNLLFAKTTLENDKEAVIATINILVSDVKEKIKIEYEKLY